ncbi:MAG TPA: calcium-binding protein [Phenylobacterium sp.]|uniref:calcium-binding protein n=1 Tax=Phenylobacterium sp. TaxID=1871053 RepID=UPI002B4A6673|nr:calcium-binding protein [Phenylobacterium sp.]HKR88055.1 calcium-binding protein [Phenylobacterium sp.]
MGIEIELNETAPAAGSLASVLSGHVVTETATTFALSYGSDLLTFTGDGFTYVQGMPMGGVVTGVTDTQNGATVFELSGFRLPVLDLRQVLEHNTTPSAIVGALPSPTDVEGGDNDDVMTVGDGPGTHQVHAHDGNDKVTGSGGDDVINGNRGDDTIDGGQGGDDTLMGGQGNDHVCGHHGHLSMNGNLGDDTLEGGDGVDVLHGGQGADLLLGGAGADHLFGDRGDDTLTGGAGGDRFYIAHDGGHDVVTDFTQADGDRIVVASDETWTVAQSGQDTVVTLSGGETMTLLNVDSSKLSAGWIVHD